MAEPVDVVIDQYYSFIFEAMDTRFQNIDNELFEINLALSGIIVAKTEAESFWTTTSVVGDGDVRALVNSSEALHKFQIWADETPGLPLYDHAVLFTGADLTYAGNAGNTGLAFAASMCRNISNSSIVEDAFDFTTAIYATQQVARSLGVSDDMDNNDCLEFFNYVMTPRVKLPSRAFTANRWHFSACSVQYLRDYLDKLQEDKLTCLVETSLSESLPTELSVLVDDLPGAVYTAQQQCRIKYGPESYICRVKVGDDYGAICGGLPCGRAGTDQCGYILPADGTPCGNKKYCEEGKCSVSEDADDVPESCPFGDQPGVECDLPASQTPALCYNDTFRYTCCDSCLHAQFGKPGCEYGDMIPSCTQDGCTGADDQYASVTCCVTCANSQSIFTAIITGYSPATTYTHAVVGTSGPDNDGTVIQSIATYSDVLPTSTNAGARTDGTTTNSAAVGIPATEDSMSVLYDESSTTSSSTVTTPMTSTPRVSTTMATTIVGIDRNTATQPSSTAKPSDPTGSINPSSSAPSLATVTTIPPPAVNTDGDVITVKPTNNDNGVITKVFTPQESTIQTPADPSSSHPMTHVVTATYGSAVGTEVTQTTPRAGSQTTFPGSLISVPPDVTSSGTTIGPATQTTKVVSSDASRSSGIPYATTTGAPLIATTHSAREGLSKKDKLFFKRLAYMMREDQSRLRATVRLHVRQILPAVKVIFRRFQDSDGEPRPDYESERASDVEQQTPDESRLAKVLSRVWLGREAKLLRRLDRDVKTMRYRVLNAVRMYLEKIN